MPASVPLSERLPEPSGRLGPPVVCRLTRRDWAVSQSEGNCCTSLLVTLRWLFCLRNSGHCWSCSARVLAFPTSHPTKWFLSILLLSRNLSLEIQEEEEVVVALTPVFTIWVSKDDPSAPREKRTSALLVKPGHPSHPRGSSCETSTSCVEALLPLRGHLAMCPLQWLLSFCSCVRLCDPAEASGGVLTLGALRGAGCEGLEGLLMEWKSRHQSHAVRRPQG